MTIPESPEPKLSLPPSLGGRQRALYLALLRKNERLARIYLGAVLVLADSANPDRRAHAAHGMRELMEKLPLELDVPVPKRDQSLKEKVRQLAELWRRAQRTSQCASAPRWKGQIDSPLAKFLKSAGAFFDWHDQVNPKRKVLVTSVLRVLDPAGRPMPTPIEELRISEWDRYHGFFQGVAHHNKGADEGQLEVWMESAEQFILDRLSPRTFEDHRMLDALIEEAENDAES